MLSFLESLSLVRGLISFRHCKISHKIHATKIFCVQKSKYSHILEPNQVCCARTRRAIDCKAVHRPTNHRSFAEKAAEDRRKASGLSPKSQRPFGEKPKHGAYTSNFLSFYYHQFKDSYYFCI